MSLSSHRLIPNSNSPISSHFTHNPPLTSPTNPIFSLPLPSKQFITLRTKSPNPNPFKSLISHRPPPRALQLDGTVHNSNTIDDFNFDAFLSIVEFLCLASSAAVSIVFFANSVISASSKPVVNLGSGVFVWQSVLLVGAVAIGALIRRRQWGRMCRDASRPEGGNLIERIERLEEDVRSSVSVVRVLSRRVEKLAIRFRVTRKTLKDPLAETAALAQKNSEDTRMLAVQEDILEKELSEIQKVLLAMQEQQQKQLELILAIGKAGKLWDTKRGPTQDQEAIKTRNSAEDGEKQMPTPQNQALAGQKESNNDKAFGF